MGHILNTVANRIVEITKFQIFLKVLIENFMKYLKSEQFQWFYVEISNFHENLNNFNS